jgi:hypothetical protein
MTRRPILRLLALGAALAACATAAARPIDARADPARIPTAPAAAVVDWNRIALQTTARAPFNPPRETRSMAIVQAAVLDAVTSITRTRPSYRVRVSAPRSASVSAAIAGAAHGTLVALYPDQRRGLDEQYARALADLAPGRTRDAGTAAGDAVASAMLALRAHDGADAAASFSSPGGPGRWVPTPPAFLPALEPGWGRVTPFLLRSSSALRPPAPPAIGSRRYAADLREIEALGSSDSVVRTPNQTAAARFWVATAPQLWNQVLQQAGVRPGISATRAASAFALLNLAGADAFIAAWDAKFAYLQWRPVTAIRAAGNSEWTPLLVTPPFPDYPAGHTAYAGAAEEALVALFGERSGELEITSPTAGGATHRYRSFREIADEVVDARVWGGVHWRTSSAVGRELGRRVGTLAVARAPRRVD